MNTVQKWVYSNADEHLYNICDDSKWSKTLSNHTSYKLKCETVDIQFAQKRGGGDEWSEEEEKEVDENRGWGIKD